MAWIGNHKQDRHLRPMERLKKKRGGGGGGWLHNERWLQTTKEDFRILLKSDEQQEQTLFF